MERHVLVTGAGSGLGLATALHLGALGFSVTGVVPDDGQIGSLTDAADRAGQPVTARRADLADPGQRAKVTEGVGFYALVNNAGYLNAGALLDVPTDAARRQLEVMVLAPMDLAQRVLPHMLARGEGRIVNVTSAAVHTSTPLSGWYQASKAALRELTDSLRSELADTGVDVVDIEPGGFRTGIWPGALADLRERKRISAFPEAYERATDAIDRLERRMAAPEEVAEVIGRVLTSGSPRPHQRVGRDATPLRIVSEVVPDRLWDRLVTARTGTS